MFVRSRLFGSSSSASTEHRGERCRAIYLAIYLTAAPWPKMLCGLLIWGIELKISAYKFRRSRAQHTSQGFTQDGAGKYLRHRTWGLGIFAVLDGGESWRVLALLLPPRYVQASRENLLRDLPRWPITRVGLDQSFRTDPSGPSVCRRVSSPLLIYPSFLSSVSLRLRERADACWPVPALQRAQGVPACLVWASSGTETRSSV